MSNNCVQPGCGQDRTNWLHMETAETCGCSGRFRLEHHPFEENKVAPSKKFYVDTLSEALEEIGENPKAPGLKITVELTFDSDTVTEALGEESVWGDDPLDQMLQSARKRGSAEVIAIEKL